MIQPEPKSNIRRSSFTGGDTRLNDQARISMMNAGTGEASRRKTIFMSNDGRDKNKELEASRFSLEPAYKSSLRDGIRENLKKPLSRKPKR